MASTGIVDVLGTASVSLKVDFLVMQVVVEEESNDPAAAQKALMEKSQEVLQYLRQQEAVQEVKTQTLQLRPMARGYQNKEKSYTARQTISFKLMNTAQYGSVVPELLKKGITGIGQVQFKSNEEVKYQQILLKRALLNAREKAVLLAGELGQSIGKAVFISDRISTGNPRPMAELKTDGGSSMPSIEVGNIALNATVNVHFQLR
ncbi:MAG: SIMPL domain-containing protein [Owenweeksia sp.]|nr:SIMPL domain-containing protein [Owenweeksia sp.]